MLKIKVLSTFSYLYRNIVLPKTSKSKMKKTLLLVSALLTMFSCQKEVTKKDILNYKKNEDLAA
mgnify:CR=1 FL=1